MTTDLVCEFDLVDEDLFTLIDKFNLLCRLCSRSPDYSIEHQLTVANPNTLKIKIYKNDRSTKGD